MVDQTSYYGLPRVGLTVDEVLVLTHEDEVNGHDEEFGGADPSNQ